MSEGLGIGGRADAELLKALATVAASMKLPITVVKVDNVGSSDSESFLTNKMPALTIHSLTRKNFSTLHSSRETLQSIQRKDYIGTYQILCGYLAYLDVYLDHAGSTGAPSK